MPLPFWFQRGNIDDNAATGVGGFAETNGEYIAGDFEVFHSAGEGKGIGGDDANIGGDIGETFGGEILGVDNGGVDVGEYFELVGTTNIVAIAGSAVGYNAPGGRMLDLFWLKRGYHLLFFGGFANPYICFYAHCIFSCWLGGLTTISANLSP